MSEEEKNIEREEFEEDENSENIEDVEDSRDSREIEEMLSMIDSLSTKLARNFYSTINILSDIVTTQERFYEGSHSRWVAEKSEQVAFELGLSDTKVLEIKIAAQLHDIGKIGFPDGILSKPPSTMTHVERQRYELHPRLGFKLLSAHRGFESIAKIILQHHERLDGSGFPMHLQGKEILPGAAIIGPIDFYHNLLFRRKKDKTFSPTSAVKSASVGSIMDSTQSSFARAMNYLHQKSGELFDTKVVEVFTDIIDIERRNLGMSTVLRLPVGRVEPGMIFAEDYYTSFGLLIAAKGEKVTKEMQKALFRFVQSKELPPKILVIRQP